MKAICLLILVVCWSMNGSEAYPDDDDAMKAVQRMLATDGGQQSGDGQDENGDKDDDRFIK